MFVCQICDRECDPKNTFKGREEAPFWVTNTIELVANSAYLRVLTCPECAQLDRPELLEGYKLRIREGRDQRYH